jgi:hypothetical protein
MSDSVATLRKTTLYRGVYPCGIDKMNDTEWEEVNGKVVSILEDKKIVEHTFYTTFTLINRHHQHAKSSLDWCRPIDLHAFLFLNPKKQS